VAAGGLESVCFIRKDDSKLQCIKTNEPRPWEAPEELGRVSQVDMNPEFDIVFVVRESDGMVVEVNLRSRTWREHPELGASKSIHVGPGWFECAIGFNNSVICDKHSPPEDLGPVLDVSVGNNLACTVKVDATIACWGRQDLNPDVFENIPEGTHTMIAASNDYSSEVCAVRTDKTVTCWGNPLVTSTFVPENLGRVREIVGGYSYFCAVRENDELVCWGDNSYGALAPEYAEDS
jgi:hypothetical protein